MKRMLIRAYFLVSFSFYGCSDPGTDLDKLEADWGQHRYSYADLSSGRTHYQDIGHSSLPTVVMIHGVSGPMTAWDMVFQEIHTNAFRAIRYDLYGRGFSERLDTEHNLDLYITQLRELIESRGVRKPFILLASSFGSVIAAEYANRYSKDEVLAVGMIGPAGFPIEVPFLAKLRDVPILGDLIFKFAGKGVILEQNEKYFVDPSAQKAHMPYYEAQLNIEGSAEAILSTMRHCPVQNFVSGFKTFGEKKITTFVVWGALDATFPYENHVVLHEAIPHMQLHTVENSAHLPQYERTEEVVPELMDFLTETAENTL